MNEQELIEQLADKEHASWARWMKYLFDVCEAYSIVDPDGFDRYKGVLIPPELVERWQLQIDTPYADLSEKEKQSDRDEVAHILPIIDKYLYQAVIAISNAQMQQGVRLHPNAMLRAIEEAK
jgi:hypothetical protein